MYGCDVCGETIYDPDEDRLCSKCVNKAINEYIKNHKKTPKKRLPGKFDE